MFAVKKFHYFIYGHSTIVRTDHQTITSLLKRTSISGRVLRWALGLQKYNLKIEYVAGSANAVADALSRSAVPANSEETPLCGENEGIVCATEPQ